MDGTKKQAADMTQAITVTKDNLQQIDFGSVVVFFYTESGAMGEAGKIEFSTADGSLYYLNYHYGDVSLDEFCNAYPVAPLGEVPSQFKDWIYFGLGAGNHLMIHEKVYEKLQSMVENLDDEMQIYQWWKSALGKPILSKQERYKWLVGKARKSYLSANDDPQAEFIWCDECEDEINLWTYWQGKGCLEPEILLVGQDWGNPFSGIGKTVLENMKQGCLSLDTDPFPTDKNLSELFREALRLNIWEKNQTLFFTNLLLGYRTGNNNGNFKKSYLDRDLIYFKELVNILQPKVVICLGRDTFTYAMKAYGKKISLPKDYNVALNNRTNTLDVNHIRFFGMAHCGNLGCLNRIGNQKGVSAREGMERQIEDWKQVDLYLKNKK